MTQKSGTIVSIFRRAHRCLPMLFLVGVLLCCALIFLGQKSVKPRAQTTTVTLSVDETTKSEIDARNTVVQEDSELQLVGLLPTIPPASIFDPTTATVEEPASQTEENLYWEFTVEEPAEPQDEAPQDESKAKSVASDEAAASPEPIAFLLAPQAVPTAEPNLEMPLAEQETPSPATELALEFPNESTIEEALQDEPTPVITPTPIDLVSDSNGNDLIDEEQQLVALILQESAEAATGNLTNSRVNQLAIAKIAEANVLADRGATFAARQRLIEVLRLVSQSKDASQGKPDYSMALRAGLRALEEAEDFSPRGSQLEAELNIELVVDAHQTPIAQQLELDKELPRQMLERYLRYAQIKLAMSVAGDPAGSMALYALGKVTSRLGRSEQLANPLAHQQAVAYQQAAVLARGDNYYATHELAVLLAESGHLDRSHKLLRGLANSHQNPTLLRNLARVQEQLGLPEQAAATRSMAIAFSSSNPHQGNRVRWVAPQQFGNSSTPSQYATPRPSNMVLKPTHDRRTAQAPVDRNAMRAPPQLPPQQWR